MLLLRLKRKCEYNYQAYQDICMGTHTAQKATKSMFRSNSRFVLHQPRINWWPHSFFPCKHKGFAGDMEIKFQGWIQLPCGQKIPLICTYSDDANQYWQLVIITIWRWGVIMFVTIIIMMPMLEVHFVIVHTAGWAPPATGKGRHPSLSWKTAGLCAGHRAHGMFSCHSGLWMQIRQGRWRMAWLMSALIRLWSHAASLPQQLRSGPKSVRGDGNQCHWPGKYYIPVLTQIKVGMRQETQGMKTVQSKKQHL